MPHSRYTYNDISDVEKCEDLDIMAKSEEAGLCICASKDRRRIFVSGHLEYDRETLKLEYERDLEKGISPRIPKNYFPENDPALEPFHNWKSHAYLLFGNWLNYYVYQATPYDLSNIDACFKPEKTGSTDFKEEGNRQA